MGGSPFEKVPTTEALSAGMPQPSKILTTTATGIPVGTLKPGERETKITLRLAEQIWSTVDTESVAPLASDTVVVMVKLPVEVGVPARDTVCGVPKVVCKAIPGGRADAVQE